MARIVVIANQRFQCEQRRRVKWREREVGWAIGQAAYFILSATGHSQIVRSNVFNDSSGLETQFRRDRIMWIFWSTHRRSGSFGYVPEGKMRCPS